jgi:ABC-type transport system involved in cytochrome c biogenesis permease component
MGSFGIVHMTFFLVFLVVLLGIYLLPTWIAFGQKHHNRGAILALNLLLGWTLLGWIGALVWSLTKPQRPAAPSH